jgi:large subunit ribosomal protein L25
MEKLTVQARDPKVSLEKYRTEDLIPAVYYGHGEDAVSILVPRLDFIKLYREAGESAIIELVTPDESVNVLVHDIQLHPVTDKLLHIDFIVIKAGESIEVSVPIEFVGESQVVNDGEGILNRNLREIEVRTLPKDLPQSLQVDISALASLDDVIHAKDVVLPAGVELAIDPDMTVVSTTVPHEEKEEESPTEIDFDSIEATSEKGDSDESGEVEEAL